MKNTFRWLIKKIIRFFSNLFGKKDHTTVNPARVRRIAYYIAGGIGDAILAYPAIRFLQKVYPNAGLTVFVPREKYFLLSALFEDICVRQLQGSLAFLLLYGVPFRQFDLSLTNTVAVFKLGIELAALFTSRKRGGFRYPDEEWNTRAYHFTRIFSDTVHAAKQNVQLVADITQTPYDEGDVLLPEVERNEISKEVIIHPGSETGYENKRWPVERYTTIIKKLTENGYGVTVLLGPAESDMEEQFEKHEKARFMVDPSPVALVALFKRACLFIGNDSGPAHIAAFYGVPEIVLFGPVQPERSGPKSNKCIALYNAVDCSPCHFTSRGCEDNKCMQSITVEQVWREVSAQWKQ